MASNVDHNPFGGPPRPGMASRQIPVAPALMQRAATMPPNVAAAARLTVAVGSASAAGATSAAVTPSVIAEARRDLAAAAQAARKSLVEYVAEYVAGPALVNDKGATTGCPAAPVRPPFSVLTFAPGAPPVQLPETRSEDVVLLLRPSVNGSGMHGGGSITVPNETFLRALMRAQQWSRIIDAVPPPSVLVSLVVSATGLADSAAGNLMWASVDSRAISLRAFACLCRCRVLANLAVAGVTRSATALADVRATLDALSGGLLLPPNATEASSEGVTASRPRREPAPGPPITVALCGWLMLYADALRACGSWREAVFILHAIIRRLGNGGAPAVQTGADAEHAHGGGPDASTWLEDVELPALLSGSDAEPLPAAATASASGQPPDASGVAKVHHGHHRAPPHLAAWTLRRVLGAALRGIAALDLVTAARLYVGCAVRCATALAGAGCRGAASDVLAVGRGWFAAAAASAKQRESSSGLGATPVPVGGPLIFSPEWRTASGEIATPAAMLPITALVSGSPGSGDTGLAPAGPMEAAIALHRGMLLWHTAMLADVLPLPPSPGSAEPSTSASDAAHALLSSLAGELGALPLWRDCSSGSAAGNGSSGAISRYCNVILLSLAAEAAAARRQWEAASATGERAVDAARNLCVAGEAPSEGGVGGSSSDVAFPSPVDLLVLTATSASVALARGGAAPTAAALLDALVRTDPAALLRPEVVSLLSALYAAPATGAPQGDAAAAAATAQQSRRVLQGVAVRWGLSHLQPAAFRLT